MPNARKKGYSARDMKEVSDNPEFTAEDFAKAKPFAEVFPELAASIRRGRGPNKAPTKKLLSRRLSGRVIEAYKAKGPGLAIADRCGFAADQQDQVSIGDEL